jgi:hypothetical protein
VAKKISFNASKRSKTRKPKDAKAGSTNFNFGANVSGGKKRGGRGGGS